MLRLDGILRTVRGLNSWARQFHDCEYSGEECWNEVPRRNYGYVGWFTKVIDVVFALPSQVQVECRANTNIWIYSWIRHRAETLGHDDHFASRDAMQLESFSHNALRLSI